MAGHARRKAAFTELAARASKAGQTPLEYVEDWLASGKSMVKLADEVTAITGHEITRSVLDKLCKTLEEDAPARITAAHKAGAHTMVEEQFERLEEMCNGTPGKEEIAFENLRTGNTQWIASKKNRDDFGDRPAVALNLSLGSVHLDVLRRLSAEDACELQRKRIEEGEILDNPESLI